ncbi:hypothetical protein GLAREA_09277 [Glarea lozoyensis ATCC 20868]|uniref:C2H2-type domain-containing protein n=1 Tax=Glarea lozoyensis (strain ATCC 20868 / MF5171) TaxID=1116229 RepID=S3DIY4_GLAL2|nr:uncharacterized protein GLAREA_09277 [Glarea lozoyensis ATCC 20868]EPE37114.1 hypothetical protein GLAREA_09277 [Glarea lozoyensis ATCC 20868]
MAIFENRCLVLPELIGVRGCQRRPLPAEHTESFEFQSHTDSDTKSVLETSFVVNLKSKPDEIVEIACRARNGAKTRFQYRWHTSQCRYGQKLNFGEKGQLKIITPLRGGKLLAVWKAHSYIVNTLKEAVERLRNLDLSTPNDTQHYEYMSDEKEKYSPIHVLVINSAPHKPGTSATPVMRITGSGEDNEVASQQVSPPVLSSVSSANTDQRLYRCTQIHCNESFKCLADHDVHERGHPLQPPQYSCTIEEYPRIGSKGFYSEDKLSDHIKREHGMSQDLTERISR